MKETSQEAEIVISLFLGFLSKSSKFRFHSMLLSPSIALKYIFILKPIKDVVEWISVHYQPEDHGTISPSP